MIDDSSLRSTKTKMENGKNTELIVNNVESNATENVINDTISKNVTTSEEHSVSPEPTAHDFNLEFLKHLDDLKLEEAKKVKNIISDTKNVINDTKNVINDTTSKNVTQSEDNSVSPEPTAHDFNLEFLKHLDDLKSEEVKNNEIQTASKVLSDSEKLVQLQNAFTLRMKIKNDTLETTDPNIKNGNNLDSIEDKFDSNIENVTKSDGLSYSPEETAHDFNLEFLKHLDTLKAEEVKNEETEITSEVLSDAEKLSRVQQAFGLRKQIKSDTSKSVSSKWWKS